MKILVTGGAGYIGSIVVEQLIARGEQVVVFDNLYQGHRGAVHPAAAFVQGDLSDRGAIDAVLAEHSPEAIMHFASHTLVGESKFILERLLHWMDRIYGLRFAALRYFNACGASAERGEDHHPELHLIPIILEVARGKREKVTIFGDDYPTPDGTCVRDYVHVLDLAQAHILALYALDRGSRTYNLGNGTGFSVKQVVETVRQVTGLPIPVEIGPRRPGDPAVLVASSEAIRRNLGWDPQVTRLDAIVESAWRWHLAHPNGYGDS